MDNIMDLLLDLKKAAGACLEEYSLKTHGIYSDASRKLAGAVRQRIKEGGVVTFKGTDFHRDYELAETESLSSHQVDWLYFTDLDGKRIGFRMSRADEVSVEY